MAIRRLVAVFAGLAVENLLEHLAHARPKELALLTAGVMIAATHAGPFSRVEVVLVHCAAILA